MREVPEGWVLTTLGESFRWASGGTPRKAVPEYYDGGIPWAVIGDLNDGPVEATHSSISEQGLANSSAKWVAPGAVLLAMYGSIGKLGISATRLTTNQAIAYTQPDPVLSGYLFWYLRHIRGDLSGRGKGGTQRNISQTVIKAVPFPLAPLAEQHRIVARIEALFSEFDDGVTALKRAEANLERYRASALKAAVEGRLTEQWRSDNPPDETGGELLRRILGERRKRWEEEQLAAFAGKGRKPPRNWKTRYKEPLAPDTNDLPLLPEGWCWATMDQVTSRTMNGFGRRSDTPGGEPRMVLRLADVKNGRISYSNPRHLDCTPAQIAKYKVGAADVLIIRVNGSANLVGRLVSCEDTPQDVLFCDHFIRAKCVDQKLGHWLRTYSDSEGFRSEITRTKVSSAGQHTVNQGSILAIPVPIPPERERVEVRKVLEAGLGKTESAEKGTAKASRLITALRQSILKRAFEGRLVPQDPDDEPAAVLLHRIRAARKA